MGPPYLHRHDSDAAHPYRCVWDYMCSLWRWISKTTSLTTGSSTYTKKESFTLLTHASPLYTVPWSDSTGGLAQDVPITTRAFSLDKQVPETETETSSGFLGPSSTSHKHCRKHHLSRPSGYFGIALQPCINMGYFIALSFGLCKNSHPGLAAEAFAVALQPH